MIPRILVLDDNAMTLEITKDALENEGFDVEECEDGQSARRKEPPRSVEPAHPEGQGQRDHGPLALGMSRGIASFITDLKQRGMLEDTLVIWGGEFGRTPTVELPTPGANSGKINGRDHNNHGFTMWLAGGGVRGGTVYGATDEFGFAATENVVHVHDLHATLMWLLGFDHEKFTFHHAGRDYRLTDLHGKIVREIMA